MAAAALVAVMRHDERKTVHPFFAPPNGINSKGAHEGYDVTHAEKGITSTELPEEVPGKSKKPRKQGKQSTLQGEHKQRRQKTLQDILNPRGNTEIVGETVDALEDSEKALLVDDGESPRRRRRTSKSGSRDAVGDARVTIPTIAPRAGSPCVVIPSPSTETLATATNLSDENCIADPSKTPPKKLLRLNASGKFSSPLSRTQQSSNGEGKDVPRRRRKARNSKDKFAAEVRLVTIAYGQDGAKRATIGERINRILAGLDSVVDTAPCTPKRSTPRKSRTARGPPKPTHPFFNGKAKNEPAAKSESPRKTTAITPGKLKSQMMRDRCLDITVRSRDDTYTAGSGLLKDRMMVKHPGAREPAWPDRTQRHVRGLDDGQIKVIKSVDRSLGVKRKRKTIRQPLSVEESVLHTFGSTLVEGDDRVLQADGFYGPHPLLRLPSRLLLNGSQIRQEVAGELSSTFQEHNRVSGHQTAQSPDIPHPALQHLWDELPHALTAFDLNRGETQGWTTKYAPTKAAHALQSSQEMAVLQAWLKSLMVTTVESVGHTAVGKIIDSQDKPRRKRRRKHEDLDDFLVDSDEEIHDMDVLTESEDVNASGTTKSQPSVVQVTHDGAKSSNVLLLSGVPGCGKTAAAYAVAKELGFRIFEISSSDRRSGKDVLDKVGNMTENHLVKHHGTSLESGSQTLEELGKTERIEEAFQKDLASGRQGKMSAFFRSNAKKSVKQPDLHKQAVKARTLVEVQAAISKPPKDQQQSLILLEEVDVLFRDDKEFWATVMKLIITSKRPFIMTCNDEDLVPLQAMSFHAILRLSPPPQDLAVDYLILVAATEGHLLKRDAVSTLYSSKGHDLRATLSALDFWCRMGVGDSRGGLAWIYQRWPPGSDIDVHGKKLRVVSRETYQNGMGIALPPCLAAESSMLDAWHESGDGPTTTLGWENMSEVDWDDGRVDTNPKKRQTELLDRVLGFTDALSAVDTFTLQGLAATAPLDTTQPALTERERNQHIEGLRLLQTDEYTDHLDLSSELAVTAICAVYRECGVQRAFHNRLKDGIQHRGSQECEHNALNRHNFACFDAISAPPENALAINSGFVLSSFDGPLRPIATDIAPYVRSIVQYDLALEEQRERLSSILADCDRQPKRARTTRAARSALEGSQRASTRRDRWFTKNLDLKGVLATAGVEWPTTTIVPVSEAPSAEDLETPTSSAGARSI